MEGADNDTDLSLATESSATDDFDVDAILNSRVPDPVSKQTFKSKHDKVTSSPSSVNLNNKSPSDSNDDFHDSSISPNGLKNGKKVTGGNFSLYYSSF